MRSLEGLILPDIGNTARQFVHRCQTFAVASHATEMALTQIFESRSKVEHLHNALDAFPGDTPEEKETLLYLRARQVDALARFAIRRIIEIDALREAIRPTMA